MIGGNRGRDGPWSNALTKNRAQHLPIIPKKLPRAHRSDPMAVTRNGSRLAPAISEDDLRNGSSIEIVLDKILPLRYIGFTFIIRYVDDRIALSL